MRATPRCSSLSLLRLGDPLQTKESILRPEDVTIGLGGIVPTADWLFQGIRRYWLLTGAYPRKLILNANVLSQLRREMPWLHDEIGLCSTERIGIEVSDEECPIDQWNDASSWLDGDGGRLRLISDSSEYC